MIMDLLNVAWVSVASVVALFLMTKLMGNKQMSELNMFDYIVGITIGSIAAEMATALESDWLKPLVAMVVYALVATLISFVTVKSIKARRFIEGRTVILCRNGRLYKKNFSRTKLDINEFLTQCRVNGYFTLSDIEMAVMEPNGRISIMPKATLRPIIPKDMGIVPPQSSFDIVLIADGRVLEENLKATGNNQKWLENEIRQQGAHTASEVFLATVDKDNKLTVYKSSELEPKNDLFQ